MRGGSDLGGLRRACLLLALAGLAGCGPVSGGRLLADERVLRAIRVHYDAHAREAEGCGEPFITRLRSGWTSSDAVFAAPRATQVEYDWEAPALAPGAPACQGQGRRTFFVLLTADGPVVTGMSGPLR